MWGGCSSSPNAGGGWLGTQTWGTGRVQARTRDLQGGGSRNRAGGEAPASSGRHGRSKDGEVCHPLRVEPQDKHQSTPGDSNAGHGLGPGATSWGHGHGLGPGHSPQPAQPPGAHLPDGVAGVGARGCVVAFGCWGHLLETQAPVTASPGTAPRTFAAAAATATREENGPQMRPQGWSAPDTPGRAHWPEDPSVPFCGGRTEARDASGRPGPRDQPQSRPCPRPCRLPPWPCHLGRSSGLHSGSRLSNG